MDFDQAMKAYYKERDALGIGKRDNEEDMGKEAQRKWKYTVNRQFGFPHYHVTLFPDDYNIKEDLKRLWNKWDIDYCGHTKFNTQAESEKFIVSVRRALSRRGMKLRLLAKDLAI